MATHSRVLAWRIPGTEEWWASVYGVAQSWTRLKRLSSSSSSNSIYVFFFLFITVISPHLVREVLLISLLISGSPLILDCSYNCFTLLTFLFCNVTLSL